MVVLVPKLRNAKFMRWGETIYFHFRPLCSHSYCYINILVNISLKNNLHLTAYPLPATIPFFCFLLYQKSWKVTCHFSSPILLSSFQSDICTHHYTKIIHLKVTGDFLKLKTIVSSQSLFNSSNWHSWFSLLTEFLHLTFVTSHNISFLNWLLFLNFLCSFVPFHLWDL